MIIKDETYIRENIDTLENLDDYIDDASIDLIREFKDKIKWDFFFYISVKHREDVRKEFKREIEECDYLWDDAAVWEGEFFNGGTK